MLGTGNPQMNETQSFPKEGLTYLDKGSKLTDKAK